MRTIAATVMLLACAATATAAVLAAPPATRAATRPTAATKPAKPPPKQKFTLMNGAVRFLVPDGWTEDQRTDDGRSAQYHSPDDQATIYVGVLPEEYPIPQHNEAFKENMKNTILKSMRQHQQESHTEVLYGPKSETDDRFLLRIHDRIKDGHETLDQLHLYRAAGLNLLMVTAVVKSDKPDEAKAFFTIGEETCLSIVQGPADKKK